MKIGEIGQRFQKPTKVNYLSTQTFLEYDALIVNISSACHNSRQQNFNIFLKRKRDLEKFISFKKIPIIYLALQQDEAATIENRSVVTMTIDKYFPIPQIKISEEQGTDIKIVQKTALTEFLEKYKSCFAYTHFYEKYSGTPTATTPLTNKVLAFYDDSCIFLPSIRSFEGHAENDFLKDLIEAASLVRFDPKSNPLPKWAEGYFVPGERESRDNIGNLKQQFIKLNNEIQVCQIKVESLEEKKRLFTASGDELERQIEVIFRELGFEILEAERNRDDLIVKYNEQIAILEIKGVNSSAAEKNAAQLEKWRATYLEVYGINPKGILIVNAYKELPIAERTEPAFPDQMLKYATGREHCLMTILQLMAIYFEVQKTPEKKDEIIQSLFSTTGRYSDKYKWQDYVSSKVDDG